jgi:hypothetical protein
MLGAFETRAMGGPVVDPYASAGQNIENAFRQFLSLKEMDKLGVPGVPTQAALEGRSKRFKSGKGPAPRPSFIDTGQYQSTFRAWVA